MNLPVLISLAALLVATGFVSYWSGVSAAVRESESEIAELRDEVAFLKSVIKERNIA